MLVSSWYQHFSYLICFSQLETSRDQALKAGCDEINVDGCCLSRGSHESSVDVLQQGMGG